ncbi:hypothetical protein ACOMHN_008608 [Nucella lapillus]
MAWNRAWKILFVALCLLGATEGFQWKSLEVLADGSTFPACFQQDVTLPWNYIHTAEEYILNVEWRFVPNGSTKEVTLATQVHGHFFTDEVNGRHIQFVPSAGLRLLRVTSADMGTYSVHVHLSQNGASHTYVQNVNLVVTDSSMAVGDSLEARYEGARYINSTREHHLLLTCGTFTHLWQPEVNVQWMTPDNQTLPSTFQDNGHFTLAVPNPFDGGQYTCKIDNSSAAAICIPSDSTLLRGATVIVDPVEGRLSLLASEMATLNAELTDLNSQNAAMTGQAQGLAANSTDMASQIQTLENQKNRLENEMLTRFHNNTG